MFVWNNWRLVSSFRNLPRPPSNWRDSEQVRTFTIALARSSTMREITALTPIKWDDRLREAVAKLAENVSAWNIAWEFANGDFIEHDNQNDLRRLTLRERLRNRISRDVQSGSIASGVEVLTTEELVGAIQTLCLVFDKSKMAI